MKPQINAKTYVIEIWYTEVFYMGKRERWSKDEMPICHGTKDDPKLGFLIMIQGRGT